MKASTAPNKKIKATSATRRVGGGIPIDEMRRLMRVYGSIKCLRKRQKTGDETKNAKIDSIKRKFYRWFPDFDERFERVDAGSSPGGGYYYRPKFGHKAEIKYREEMRARDGEVLTRKRVTRRRQRRHDGVCTTMMSAIKEEPVTSEFSTVSTNFCARLSPIFSPRAVVSPLSFPKREEEWSVGSRAIELEFDNDRLASAGVVADIEPLDGSFTAERGIFDAVDRSFYGGESATMTAQDDDDCHGSGIVAAFPSCSRLISVEEQGSPNSEEGDFADIKDVLDRSIEECCEEILGSSEDEDANSMPGFLVDMISC